MATHEGRDGHLALLDDLRIRPGYWLGWVVLLLASLGVSASMFMPR